MSARHRGTEEEGGALNAYIKLLRATDLTATNTVIAELAQDWSRPDRGALLEILFGEVLPRIG